MGYLALVFNSYHTYNLSHVKFSGSQKVSQGSRGCSPSHSRSPSGRTYLLAVTGTQPWVGCGSLLQVGCQQRQSSSQDPT